MSKITFNSSSASKTDLQNLSDIKAHVMSWSGKDVHITSHLRDEVKKYPATPSEVKDSEIEISRILPVDKFKMGTCDITNDSFSFNIGNLVEFDTIELDTDRNEITVYPSKVKVTDTPECNPKSHLVDSHIKCYIFKLAGAI
ncbi:MAG: hypothetical protein AUK48_15915 [Oscillatoriales cyanobacterium CG2_30_44_21]|nr:MAG: hypothetical protein AUK48_15915 [Oscillatoriales cyanobacterium CG2_30_44_21]